MYLLACGNKDLLTHVSEIILIQKRINSVYVIAIVLLRAIPIFGMRLFNDPSIFI